MGDFEVRLNSSLVFSFEWTEAATEWFVICMGELVTFHTVSVRAREMTMRLRTFEGFLSSVDSPVVFEMPRLRKYLMPEPPGVNV
jgi:hypothetical protein